MSDIIVNLLNMHRLSSWAINYVAFNRIIKLKVINDFDKSFGHRELYVCMCVVGR